MWTSYNHMTITFTRDIHNNLILHETVETRSPEEQIYHGVFIHPFLLELYHALIIGENFPIDTEEEKPKLSEDEFKNLETCNFTTECVICMENKKCNVKLKCSHIFCKVCIKKWLTENSNTCPICRTDI